jgi:hypothetical protein
MVQPFVSRPDDVAPEAALREALKGGIDLWARHRPAMRAIHEHWNSTDELRVLWLSVMERFTGALASEIDRERKTGLALPGPDSRAIAGTLLWGTETCLYIAGLGVDTSFADETQTLEPLLAVWTGTLFGGANAPTSSPKVEVKVKAAGKSTGSRKGASTRRTPSTGGPKAPSARKRPT